MPKNSKNQNSSPEDLSHHPLLEKTKTPFDHISHIREIKDKDYYNNLSDNDKKLFNKYIILMGLSMDPSCIQNLNYLSKYFDILPNETFYKLCCALVPKGKRYVKWIKSSRPKMGKKILEIVSSYFKVSKHEAYDYCVTFFQNESNLLQLADICSSLGYEEKQIENLLEGKDE